VHCDSSYAPRPIKHQGWPLPEIIERSSWAKCWACKAQRGRDAPRHVATRSRRREQAAFAAPAPPSGVFPNYKSHSQARGQRGMERGGVGIARDILGEQSATWTDEEGFKERVRSRSLSSPFSLRFFSLKSCSILPVYVIGILSPPNYANHINKVDSFLSICRVNEYDRFILPKAIVLKYQYDFPIFLFQHHYFILFLLTLRFS